MACGEVWFVYASRGVVNISAERICFDHWNNGLRTEERAKSNENEPWLLRWEGFVQKSYVDKGLCMNVASNHQ